VELSATDILLTEILDNKEYTNLKLETENPFQ
jgi:hypothetical protein